MQKCIDFKNISYNKKIDDKEKPKLELLRHSCYISTTSECIPNNPIELAVFVVVHPTSSCLLACLMVFNVTFNNIAVIS